MLIKDLDILICAYLENRDLLCFALTNKYHYNIFQEKSLWRMKIKSFEIEDEYLCKDREDLKEYYKELYLNLMEIDFVKTAFYSILDKRCDIVSLIFKKKNLDPNYLFLFQYQNTLCKNTYYSPIVNGEMPYSYSPINLAIKTGYYPMWKLMKNLGYPLQIDHSSYYIAVINSDNIDILRDVLEYKVEIEQWVLMFAVRCYNKQMTELLLEHSSRLILEELFHFMIISFSDEYYSWIKHYNSAFHFLVKQIDVEFYKAVGAYNIDFIQLLDHYSLL